MLYENDQIAPMEIYVTKNKKLPLICRQEPQIIILIIDNFHIALFSSVPKLTALYNILQHFLSFTNIIVNTYHDDD